MIKNMRKNKGFTLIELLAVIIVLAIIALISIPLVLNSVAKAEKEAYRESLRNVLSATEVYVASEEFIEIPDEGLDVSDTRISMKNKNFTTGKVFINSQGELELEKVGNEKYCGGGTLTNLIVIESSCENLDVTKPSLSIATNSVTSNSITIVATAEDLESDISGYQFSKDNGDTWTSKQTSNVYTFDSLTNDTTYQIKVRVYNDNPSLVLSTTKVLEETTENIPLPIYSVDTTDWSQSKVVTITYPERKTGYVYEYSLDGATTWEEVASPATTKDITFNSNGNVIARISDGTNIVSGTTYEVTKIDTVAPVITVSPAIVTIVQGVTYEDAGVVATDNNEGDISSRIVKTGTVDNLTVGTYTIRYNVSDLAGNNALEVIRQVEVTSAVFNYSYTGSVQTFTAPATATYKLEVWGAQGGNINSSYKGGLGGYSTGEFALNAGEILNIYVGGVGGNQMAGVGGYNGGGNGNDNGQGGAGGGGGSDIRFNGTDLSNRIIVAGGGGGGSHAHIGGYAGGTSGQWPDSSTYSGRGGTQTAGGAGGSSGANPGTLGNGGNSLNDDGAGGGGGYYGGGGGSNDYGGGGGSGYIGGVTNGQTISGNQSMPNPSGGTMTGRTGHGYVKITFISQ